MSHLLHGALHTHTYTHIQRSFDQQQCWSFIGLVAPNAVWEWNTMQKHTFIDTTVVYISSSSFHVYDELISWMHQHAQLIPSTFYTFYYTYALRIWSNWYRVHTQTQLHTGIEIAADFVLNFLHGMARQAIHCILIDERNWIFTHNCRCSVLFGSVFFYWDRTSAARRTHKCTAASIDGDDSRFYDPTILSLIHDDLEFLSFESDA